MPGSSSDTGAISVAAVKDALKGTYQRALVWATDAKSGKRIEASWIFKLPRLCFRSRRT